jgi:hypothetical protein
VGGPLNAMLHYASLRNMCIPGLKFGEVMKSLGVTEFGTDRTTRCWPVALPPGRIVCYANSRDHGITVIVRQSASTL